jgi:hypothetical protein
MGNSLEKSLSDLESKIEDLSNKISLLEAISKKAVTRVAWQDKQSESGITLEGNASIERTGVVVSSFGVPMSATQIAIMLVIRREGDDQMVVLDGQLCKILP